MIFMTICLIFLILGISIMHFELVETMIEVLFYGLSVAVLCLIRQFFKDNKDRGTSDQFQQSDANVSDV